MKNLEERDVYYAAKLPPEWDIEKEKKIYIASQENEINVENIRTVWWITGKSKEMAVDAGTH